MALWSGPRFAFVRKDAGPGVAEWTPLPSTSRTLARGRAAVGGTILIRKRFMLEAGSVVRELQEMRDEGHLSDALLRKAVRCISVDDRFEWTGVYLLGEDEELWLHNYVGEPTVHAKIPVGVGVCGRAVAERTNLNIPDVSTEENYLMCSPDIQSELVILIRAGEDIFGQIDIDSEEKSAFTDDDEVALIGIADKLAEQLAAEKRGAS